MVEVHTPDGNSLKETYLVNIVLPNKVGVSQIRVAEGTIKDADALIGMDIIGLGDFAVTNKDDKTTFSFRMPSIECIDFVKKGKPKVGRNMPCPCGSGKKHKNCCGK